MNGYAVRAIRDGLSWRGEFRCADQGHYHIVCKDGEPRPFPSRDAAIAAAYDALVGYMNGNLVRFGPTPTLKEAARTAAERVFRKGRMIPVERRH